MTADEVRRMKVDEVLIFARGQRPIRASLLKYHEQAYFKQLAAIPSPTASDCIITAPPADDGWENESDNEPATAAASPLGQVSGATRPLQLGLLQYAAKERAREERHEIQDRSVPDR